MCKYLGLAIGPGRCCPSAGNPRPAVALVAGGGPACSASQLPASGAHAHALRHPPPLPPAPCRPRAGMALATMFVTLPFVVRELLPLLADIDPGEDEAANTLGANWLKTFFRVTLPNIKWGLLHGVLLMNAVGGWTGVGCLSGTDLGHHGPGPCAGAAGRRGSPGHPADWLATPVPCAAWMAGLARARAARLDPPTLSAPFPSEQWGSLGQSASSRGIS